MMRALVWFAILALIGTVAALAQIDRQSRYAPELAEYVPAPFRSFAQTHIAAAAVASGDQTRALQEARTLVDKRPIPAEHLRLLAQAEMIDADKSDGYLTIQRAARRGWRDPASQDAMLALALAAGDDGEVARRLAAKIAIQPTDPLLARLTPALLERAGVRDELATLLASHSRLSRAVKPRLLASATPEQRADLQAKFESAGD